MAKKKQLPKHVYRKRIGVYLYFEKRVNHQLNLKTKIQIILNFMLSMQRLFVASLKKAIEARTSDKRNFNKLIESYRKVVS